MVKGVLKFHLGEKDLTFFPCEGEAINFKDLDEFIDYNFGCRGAAFYMPLSDINVIYRYLEEQQSEKYSYNILKAHENKIVGLSIHKANKNKPFKTFYNMKYKIGTDDLEVEDALKKISEAPH